MEHLGFGLKQKDETLTYNPPADLELKQDMTLIVMGDIRKVEEFRRLAGGKSDSIGTHFDLKRHNNTSAIY